MIDILGHIFISNTSLVGEDNITGKTLEKTAQGIVDKKNIFVRLINQTTNEEVHVVNSGESCEFLFDYLNLKDNIFYLVAHDNSSEFNGVIADNIGG